MESLNTFWDSNMLTKAYRSLNERLADGWSLIPDDSSAVFRTDDGDNKNWRSLQAYNPVDSFILDNPNQLAELKQFLNNHQDDLCAGFISYDLGLILQGISSRHATNQPLAVFHAYDAWIERIRGFIKVKSSGNEFYHFHTQSPDPSSNNRAKPILQFEATVPQNEYSDSIHRIHEYIRAGDIYQINYTQALTAKTDVKSRDLFADLIQKHPAAYGCYFESEDMALHSLSPELFLHYADGILTTEPIKGTRPRGKTEQEDELLKQQLLSSEKEQAELFMITDLLRNDLGKVCEIGSVELNEIKQLHKLPKVWHTSSRISGKLLADLKPIDALLSMLPGGSISGCPKKRALEVIEELEGSARGIYTGSIGYFHPNGDFSFNIAIRTLVQQGQNLSLGTGGGITIDSNWEDEWDELLVKASTFQ